MDTIIVEHYGDAERAAIASGEMVRWQGTSKFVYLDGVRVWTQNWYADRVDPNQSIRVGSGRMRTGSNLAEVI